MKEELTERLARALDPDAFEDHPIEARQTQGARVAAIQWAARRHIALQGAARAVAAGFTDSNDEPAPEPQRFCDQCEGPYPLNEWPGSQYAGHWDTCPNRWAAIARDPEEIVQRLRAHAGELRESVAGKPDPVDTDAWQCADDIDMVLDTLDRLRRPLGEPIMHDAVTVEGYTYYPGDNRMAVTVHSVYGGFRVILPESNSNTHALQQALQIPIENWEHVR